MVTEQAAIEGVAVQTQDGVTAPVAVEEAPVASSDPEVATSSEPVANPEVELTPDEPTEPAPPRPTTRAALIELHPELEDVLPKGPVDLREWDSDLATTTEYAAEQRKEAELKHAAGDEAQTRRRVANIMQRHNLPSEETDEVGYTWSLAKNTADIEAVAGQVTAFGELFGDSEVGELLMEKFRASRSIDVLKDSGKVVAERAVEHAVANTLRTIDGPDVTEEMAPKLYKWIQGEVVRRQAAEATADGIPEPGNPRPATSQGNPVGTSGPTAEEYKSASPSQRREWRKQGVEIRA